MTRERLALGALTLASLNCNSDWTIPEAPNKSSGLTDSSELNRVLLGVRDQFEDLCLREGPDAPGDSFSRLSFERDSRLRENGYPAGKIGWMCHYPRRGETAKKGHAGEFAQLVAARLPLRRVQNH